MLFTVLFRTILFCLFQLVTQFLFLRWPPPPSTGLSAVCARAGNTTRSWFAVWPTNMDNWIWTSEWQWIAQQTISQSWRSQNKTPKGSKTSYKRICCKVGLACGQKLAIRLRASMATWEKRRPDWIHMWMLLLSLKCGEITGSTPCAKHISAYRKYFIFWYILRFCMTVLWLSVKIRLEVESVGSE